MMARETRGKEALWNISCPVTPVGGGREGGVFVGQIVEFDPMAHIDGNSAALYKGHKVWGKVVYINAAHRWFLVVYPGGRLAFHFADLAGDASG